MNKKYLNKYIEKLEKINVEPGQTTEFPLDFFPPSIKGGFLSYQNKTSFILIPPFQVKEDNNRDYVYVPTTFDYKTDELLAIVKLLCYVLKKRPRLKPEDLDNKFVMPYRDFQYGLAILGI